MQTQITTRQDMIDQFHTKAGPAADGVDVPGVVDTLIKRYGGVIDLLEVDMLAFTAACQRNRKSPERAARR